MHNIINTVVMIVVYGVNLPLTSIADHRLSIYLIFLTLFFQVYFSISTMYLHYFFSAK